MYSLVIELFMRRGIHKLIAFILEEFCDLH